MTHQATSCPNKVSVELVREKSRVTELKYRTPLRIFTADRFSGENDQTAGLIMSNHGGGMLQGDRIYLQLSCHKGTRTYLGNQANSHIFKNSAGNPSSLNIHGSVFENASVFVNSEPLVLHRKARFEQTQTWNLAENANFILTDWLQSGRSESGEKFAFSSYMSGIRISVENRPVVYDRLRCIPENDNPESYAAFMGMDHYFTMYVIGPDSEKIISRVRVPERQINARVFPLGDTERLRPVDFIYSISPMQHANGHILRVLSKSREAFMKSLFPDGIEKLVP